MDRITGEPAYAGRFPHREPPAEDMATYFSRALSTTPYRYQTTVLLHAPVGVVAERVSPSSGVVKARTSTPACCTSAGPSLAEFPVYVAQIGFDFEILDLPELVEQVLAERFGRAAGFIR